MGSFANYLEDALLDHAFKTAPMSVPTNLYIALCRSTIEEDDTGATLPTEVSGGAYARIQCNTWDAASGGAIENSQPVTFAEATANWQTVTDFGVVDSVTAGQGNLLCFGKLGTEKKIGTGDTAKFATGDLDVTLD